jgi:hypothetical protein
MQTDATNVSREERRALLEQRRSVVAHQLRRLAIELTDIDRQLDDIEQSDGWGTPDDRDVDPRNHHREHTREVLGDQTYESLARKGETMKTAAMATYPYDEIDGARTELNAVSK